VLAGKKQLLSNMKLNKTQKVCFDFLYNLCLKYEGWNFNSGNYLFTTDTK